MCQVNNERERDILGEEEDQIGREPIRWRRRRKKKVNLWETEREKKKRTFDFRCSDGWKSIGQELKLVHVMRATCGY